MIEVRHLREENEEEVTVVAERRKKGGERILREEVQAEKKGPEIEALEEETEGPQLEVPAAQLEEEVLLEGKEPL